MTARDKSPLQFFAELESEIAKFHVAPPKTWPWAKNSDGTTNMPLRNLQMLEFLEDLRRKERR